MRFVITEEGAELWRTHDLRREFCVELSLDLKELEYIL